MGEARSVVPDPAPQAPDRPALPEHVTTPLLTLITARSLDEDYAHVARRRRAEGDEPPTPVSRRRRLGTVLTVVAFGVLTATVAAQTSRDAEATELGRAALQDQIESQRARVRELQETVRALENANQEEGRRNQVAGAQLADLRSTVERLELRTGFSAVRGPGLRITVDNAPSTPPDDEIVDEDLAVLVDGLWEAGAEAIAINDQRINVLGGIRNINRAVHVNGVPISAPYVVSVIGDRSTLQANLLASSQGQEWFALVNVLGFEYEAATVADVRLPGASLRPLRAVKEMSDEPPGASEGGMQ